MRGIPSFGLFNILAMIAFTYCVIKIFFANIKRGGILLIQMAVGSLYMFSLPRGYQDGFNQWVKQVIAICLTAFMQTTLLYLGLLIFPKNMLLGLGVMLSANEVPRIAEQFGLDSSVKVNMMSVVHATTTAVNLTRSVARAVSYDTIPQGIYDGILITRYIKKPSQLCEGYRLLLLYLVLYKYNQSPMSPGSRLPGA